jgi:hypothetical protein
MIAIPIQHFGGACADFSLCDNLGILHGDFDYLPVHLNGI